MVEPTDRQPLIYLGVDKKRKGQVAAVGWMDKWMDGQTDGQKISQFYRTLFPIGATTLLFKGRYRSIKRRRARESLTIYCLWSTGCFYVSTFLRFYALRFYIFVSTFFRPLQLEPSDPWLTSQTLWLAPYPLVGLSDPPAGLLYPLSAFLTINLVSHTLFILQLVSKNL